MSGLLLLFHWMSEFLHTRIFAQTAGLVALHNCLKCELHFTEGQAKCPDQYVGL